MTNYSSLNDEELNHQVALKVMDYTRPDYLNPPFYEKKNGDGPKRTALQFSFLDPAHSDMIVDKMVEKEFDIAIMRSYSFVYGEKVWAVLVRGGDHIMNPSKHRAIAIAALMAMEKDK